MANEKAVKRDNSGDTVKGLLNGYPDSDASSESNQIRYQAPGKIKPQAIQNAGKRKMNVKYPGSLL